MKKTKLQKNSSIVEHYLSSFTSIILCCVAIVSIISSGCKDDETRSIPPVPVTASKAEIRSEPLSLNFVGTVEPVENVSVKSQVSGVITGVNFIEGQEVKAGQLLIQIDARSFQADLDRAEAQLAKDKAEAANADVQANRLADLFKKELVSQERYDTSRTQAEMLKSVVQADEAAVKEAKLNLEYSSITAPISGRTGGLLVKRGNVVRLNDTTLVVINQMRPIRVSFAIPGNQLPLVQKYSSRSKLEVKVKPSRDDEKTEVRGVLTFMDNSVDTNTGTVTLKAEFSNKEGLLWPGQFVDTELILTVEPAVLTIPAGAVVTGQEGTFVFVIGSDKKVEKRLVKVNRSLNNTVVIDEGLKAGEVVVTDGQMRLVPGVEVDIKNSVQEKGNAR
jgi:multidrug efflux system membrane fusion protein